MNNISENKNYAFELNTNMLGFRGGKSFHGVQGETFSRMAYAALLGFI
jgi:hypothetical protein